MDANIKVMYINNVSISEEFSMINKSSILDDESYQTKLEVYGCILDIVSHIDHNNILSSQDTQQFNEYQPQLIHRKALPSYFERSCIIFFLSSSRTWKKNLDWVSAQSFCKVKKNTLQ